MDVDIGYKGKEKTTGGVQWYTMETKVFIWSIKSNIKMKMEE